MYAHSDLYYRALEKERRDENPDHASVINAVKNIQKAYKRISKFRQIAAVDYNDVNYRCAYVSQYAVCHTIAVTRQAISFRDSFALQFHSVMRYAEEDFGICSLGGGPGSDVIGLLTARLWDKGSVGRTKRVWCRVVDICKGWRVTLQNVFETYTEKGVGKIYRGVLRWDFVESDLRKFLSQDVIEAIRRSDVLNMVKFVSVISHSCNYNPGILKNIFKFMKLGSYVFFMDNSAGGFYEMTSDAALSSGLSLIVPPIRTRWDTNFHPPAMFGKPPLTSTSACFALWQKRHVNVKANYYLSADGKGRRPKGFTCNKAINYQREKRENFARKTSRSAHLKQNNTQFSIKQSNAGASSNNKELDLHSNNSYRPIPLKSLTLKYEFPGPSATKQIMGNTQPTGNDSDMTNVKAVDPTVSIYNENTVSALHKTERGIQPKCAALKNGGQLAIRPKEVIASIEDLTLEVESQSLYSQSPISKTMRSKYRITISKTMRSKYTLMLNSPEKTSAIEQRKEDGERLAHQRTSNQSRRTMVKNRRSSELKTVSHSISEEETAHKFYHFKSDRQTQGSESPQNLEVAEPVRNPCWCL